ncbi:GL18334 [Drosophila persimilis]|uniref:GL18334 n=1 Tax=Drosophila persimilis TaxID=7234 RepID=B4H4H8_DROPE|nr:GL18334 [Drosophila persimilis]
MNAAPEDHIGTNEIVDLTGDTDSERSDVYTDTESETSSSTDGGEEYPRTRRRKEETPETRSITLQGGPSELPSYQQAQKGILPRIPRISAPSFSAMGDRFDDYSRPRDVTPDLRGHIATDEGDSPDEDNSHHGNHHP